MRQPICDHGWPINVLPGTAGPPAVALIRPYGDSEAKAVCGECAVNAVRAELSKGLLLTIESYPLEGVVARELAPSQYPYPEPESDPDTQDETPE